MPNRPVIPIVCICSAGLMMNSAACSSPKTHRSPSISTQSNPDPHIVALINGTPITHEHIRDDMSERVGRQSIMDLALDHQLVLELQRLNLQITPTDLEAEELIFVRTVAPQGSSSSGYQLLESLRSTRGLGPDRYQRFLRRNAMLRKLVGESGSPNESEFLLAERIAFGPKFRIRLYVSDNEQHAIELRQRVNSTPIETRRWIFSDACAESSTHPSASRGGLITDLSTDDPGYPSVLSDAIQRLSAHQLSPVLATSAGFVVVLMESEVPAIEPTLDQIRSVREQLALRKQRLEMERLADELLTKADVTVMDRALNWAWTNKP